MKKSIIAAGALSLLTLVGCSENATAGNEIEPNAVANNSSSSGTTPDEGSSSSNSNTEYTINFDEIYTFSTDVTGKEKVGLALISTYKEENAASASCTVKKQELTGIVKIHDGLITRAYSGKNLCATDVDEFVYMFKKTCANSLTDANKTIDSLVTGDNSFDFACVSGTDYMSIDEALGMFESIMSDNCKQLEIRATLDSLDSASAANTPAKIVFTDDNPDEIITINTAERTLANYTLQYAKPEELSFDSHVLAYSSNLSTDCFKAMDKYEENENGITLYNAPIMSIEKDVLPTCFPKTESVADFSRRSGSCKYYLVSSDDGAQPTGHVLSKVSKDTVETISIAPGGTCMQSFGFFTVYFLVEDCDGIISENTNIIRRGATSKRWACEEGNYSPSLDAISYGEWYSESLLEH
ncbi:hypothetical protein [Fibrobacter sp. UWEL]|uniref:hypothetical protein n=1 Tax=Fibrobacter sp. UWEL TaxID=1896209 RepID=UPI00091A4728|nr:hypothetical protein [Fibrobacter sp. UWEL]SHK48753.1 hypothetical protein SAMN05720468_102215 [Fibrobacter sp. UWEL]